MTISQRIKYLRKNILNLTQDNFSEKIGLSRSNIANIEVSRIKVTDRTIKDICRKFNINKEWLCNEIGDIFINTNSNFTINKRLSLLRKTLGLTTRNFAEKLNITGGAITNMEKGIRNITDRTIYDICRKFNVSEEWLRYGNGEIFIENDSPLEQCLKENNATANDIELIKCYLNLDLEIRNKIHEHFKCYFSNIK